LHPLAAIVKDGKPPPLADPCQVAYFPAMAIRDIVLLPSPVLRQVSAPVTAVTGKTRALMDDMLATMYKAPGIGLAAIQVGEPLRIITIDTAKEGEDKKPLFLVNPEIAWSSDEKSDYEEGCLSIPDFYEMVTRPAAVNVRYTDRQGEAREIECSGILATCVQHEIDHLNGVLFIDYISRLKRDRVIKKFAKAQKFEQARL
jgi:peptide deformylase